MVNRSYPIQTIRKETLEDVEPIKTIMSKTLPMEPETDMITIKTITGNDIYHFYTLYKAYQQYNDQTGRRLSTNKDGEFMATRNRVASQENDSQQINILRANYFIIPQIEEELFKIGDNITEAILNEFTYLEQEFLIGSINRATKHQDVINNIRFEIISLFKSEIDHYIQTKEIQTEWIPTIKDKNLITNVLKTKMHSLKEKMTQRKQTGQPRSEQGTIDEAEFYLKVYKFIQIAYTESEKLHPRVKYERPFISKEESETDITKILKKGRPLTLKQIIDYKKEKDPRKKTFLAERLVDAMHQNGSMLMYIGTEEAETALENVKRLSPQEIEQMADNHTKSMIKRIPKIKI